MYKFTPMNKLAQWSLTAALAGFLFGFDTVVISGADQKLGIEMVDSFRVLYPDRENVGTYNGFTGQSDGPKIDYIMVRPSMKVIEASILQTNREGRYPSDHFPVTAELGLR
mgnify:CR=1 FL=1